MEDAPRTVPCMEARDFMTRKPLFYVVFASMPYTEGLISSQRILRFDHLRQNTIRISSEENNGKTMLLLTEGECVSATT